MATDSHDAERQDQLTEVLGHAITYVSNEAIVLAQYESIHEGQFSKLWSHHGIEDVGQRLTNVMEHLGAPPEFHLQRNDEERPPADNYPEAILTEAVQVFNRARKSVVRAHMFMTGSGFLADMPSLMNVTDDPEGRSLFIKQAQAAFWEHAEAAYIRLYSFWDRVGQVLDFAFFNIRKFDQNGFNAVMDRIHANVIPMDVRLAQSSGWKRLRSFQTSAKETGLKWLLQRRNLIIHSLHLHPVENDEEGVFKSQFNHLDVAHREKLRPRDELGEVGLLVGQLEQACELFSDFLTVVEFSPSRQQDKFSGTRQNP